MTNLNRLHQDATLLKSLINDLLARSAENLSKAA